MFVTNIYLYFKIYFTHYLKCLNYKQKPQTNILLLEKCVSYNFNLIDDSNKKEPHQECENVNYIIGHYLQKLRTKEIALDVYAFTISGIFLYT